MKNIIKSGFIVMAVAAIAGFATYSYFSDSATSTGNTFSAGTLNLQLADSNEGWSEGVSSTWSSPANWMPGQEVKESIYLRNTGSTPAEAVYANWHNLSDPNGMANFIEVTWLSDSTQIDYNNIAPFVTRYDAVVNGGNNDGKLSLAELVNGVGSSSTPPPFQARFYADEHETYATPVLPYAANGGVFEIKMGYKFMESAGNALQGATASFDLTLKAAQKHYISTDPNTF